jgi:hypothetical protein
MIVAQTDSHDHARDIDELAMHNYWQRIQKPHPKLN